MPVKKASSSSSERRRRVEKLAKEGFLPIRETFLVTTVPEKTSAEEEEEEAFTTTQSKIGTIRDDFDDDDDDEKPLLKKRGGILLLSNKNGVRRGAKSQKQRKKEKYAAMRQDLCRFVAIGKACPYESTSCERVHDAEKYASARRDGFGGRGLAGRCFEIKCPYEKKMKDVKCPFGIRCYFYERHENDRSSSKETKTLLEWRRSEGSEEFNTMEDRLQKELRESTYRLPRSTKYLEKVRCDLLCVSKTKKRKIAAMNREKRNDDANENEHEEKTEKNAINFNKKLILAPLTTVGHAPFRRLCVKFGADVTISEMAMASNLLAGDRREWALLRRHACESSKTNKFGVQICGGYPDLIGRCVVRFIVAFVFSFSFVVCFARYIDVQRPG